MYGDGAFGEASFGEGPGGGFPPVMVITGSMAAVDPTDIFAASGTVPPQPTSAIADPSMLVLVVELEMGQLV